MSIEKAILDIQRGKMVIITDDHARENEGDLVMAADKITADAINFMAHEGCGLICMPMAQDYFIRLNIPMMVSDNQSTFSTAFGVSIGAKKNITTGISAADRALTIRVAADPLSTEKDIVKPGHIFPLKAVNGGVLKRKGHTEASVDLMRLAGLNPAAAICEIMNRDGSMARERDLKTFAEKHALTIISVEDILQHRVKTEVLVEKTTTARLPTEFGEMCIHVFRTQLDDKEWVVVTSGEVKKNKSPLVRLHSQCFTGDVLHSLRCDCGDQLKASLKLISENTGILIYLPQEGRGIGLENKIKAYALQDQGFDTVEANRALGFEDDLRDYSIAAQILKSLSIASVKLMTNNPAKIAGLEKHGISVDTRIPLEIASKENQQYLKTKKEKLGHLLKV